MTDQQQGSEPAYPSGRAKCDVTGNDYAPNPGFTQRQRAAIDLCVPDSGTDWLDEMIRKSPRMKLAGQAMEGEMTREDIDHKDSCAERCLAYADALLSEGDSP